MVLELLTNRYPGMRIWLSQRFTALVMAGYLVFLLAYAIYAKPNNYAAWQAFITPWWMRILTAIFFVCLSMHAWIGVRDVLRDYVFNAALRAKMQVLVDLLLIVYLVWFLFLVFG